MFLRKTLRKKQKKVVFITVSASDGCDWLSGKTDGVKEISLADATAAVLLGEQPSLLGFQISYGVIKCL